MENFSPGNILREWRTSRGFSQLSLALEAEVSSRHLSFLETGRANPSRDMVLRLAEVLQMPLRDRNGLLVAAGFAPVFGESDLTQTALAPVRKAVSLILKSHEPYPAVAIDADFQIIDTNAGFAGLQNMLGLDPQASHTDQSKSMLGFLFEEGANRDVIENWADVVRQMVARLRTDLSRRGPGGRPQQLLNYALAQPGVAQALSGISSVQAPALVPITFKVGDLRTSWITTITSFGSPTDAFVEELSIEQYHPADAETEAVMRQLSPANRH